MQQHNRNMPPLPPSSSTCTRPVLVLVPRVGPLPTFPLHFTSLPLPLHISLHHSLSHPHSPTLTPLQLSKAERELKTLRLKLKQAAARLEKAQALGSKLQELGAGLVADAQPPAME
jgi:hypothetical protein